MVNYESNRERGKTVEQITYLNRIIDIKRKALEHADARNEFIRRQEEIIERKRFLAERGEYIPLPPSRAPTGDIEALLIASRKDNITRYS